MVPRTCEHCKEPIFTYVTPGVIAAGGGRFCSVRCANAAKFGNPVDRFWKNVQKGDGCWLWTVSVDKDGYGKFYADGKHIRAHVYSFILHHGPVPKGAFVCHECDNPTCVRPDHLWLGDAISNNRDAARKGHHQNGSEKYLAARPRGMKSTMSKFTDDQIRDIRQLYAAGGISQQRIADRYGVDQTCISTIVRRASWKHI